MYLHCTVELSYCTAVKLASSSDLCYSFLSTGTALLNFSLPLTGSWCQRFRDKT
ncbi:UNVERIFIED_CONTAM: hypothetical protein FKN15_004717 [Acipenser sinensis]